MKILVVDDESRMRKLIKDFLVKSSYEVIEADNGKAALEAFDANEDISLVVLDVMMPVMDGWEVCKAIREKSQVPIIMLTARAEEIDELNGFSLGIDEYVTKPFSPSVLVARIGALIRRAGLQEDVIVVDNIVLDRRRHIVKVDGDVVELSYKEYELLLYFMNNRDVALSREKILKDVWNYDYYGDARTIDTHVKKLRSKLGDCSEAIKTVWGYGYKFVMS